MLPMGCGAMPACLCGRVSARLGVCADGCLRGVGYLRGWVSARPACLRGRVSARREKYAVRLWRFARSDKRSMRRQDQKAIRAGLRKAFCAFFPYTERVTFVHSDRFVFHNIRSPDKMQEAPPSFPVFYPRSAHATTCIPGLSVRGCAGRRLSVYSFPDCMEAAIHSDRALSQTLRPHYRAGIPACQS